MGYRSNSIAISRDMGPLTGGESAINPNYLGTFAKFEPRLVIHVGPVGGLQKLFMLGRLAVPKTLEIKGQILTEIILCDPLGPDPTSPPNFLSSIYLWHIFGSPFPVPI